ncbi:CaiB/BaiF CoA-transferase family protein [Sphingobium sp. EM0848]|uniref:CaiB/BaiF CoA transferase family protein n=1 Tax=Sphingobium sp. EM0848 TaxID=2743473 RepID=UPI00159C012F|nr:CaiB/BaiF CoA-transferase family protein [Sphingobium sp. EM0848]
MAGNATSHDIERAGPLADIRVLDLTRVIAGPLATQIIGDLGADIVKIERPNGGDDSRHIGPPWMPGGAEAKLKDSTYYHSVNRNKRSMTVDFSNPRWCEILREMAKRCDVFVENFRPGTLRKYGLDYENLKQLNPGLIYCSLSGFGQDGPYSSRSGYDYLAQGMSGLMTVTGHPEDMPGGGPMRVGIPLVDILSGMNAATAIIAAIRHRDRMGEGQHIDISLFESAIASMLNPTSAWLNSQHSIGLTSNDHPSAAPYGIFEVDDGHLIIATFSDREFVRLAKALGHEEWIEDPRFAQNEARVANRETLKQFVTHALRGRTRAEWTDLLNAATVSCGPINKMEDLELDPQVIAREILVSMDRDAGIPVRTIASPLRFSSSPASYRRPPPAPGEHTAEILHEYFDLTEEEIASLYGACDADSAGREHNRYKQAET